MASLPDGITLDIPDLRVTITPRSDYVVKIQPVDEYHVVTFDTPTITRATSVFVDYAQSASYANSAGSAVSASYAEVSATSSYADNFVVAGGVTASGFVGDGSQLTGVTAEGTGVSVQDGGVFQGVSQVIDFTDGLDVSFSAPTSSISLNRTGSFSGSFTGDGSGLTDIVSASFATTASYVEGATSDWDTLANKPAGLVSSSVQINTGSFSGSFTGDGSGLTGLISASHALNADNAISASYSVTASYADNAGASDWSELTNVPSGLVSSSTQTIANINGQEITPSIISSSGHIVPSTTEIYDLGSTDLRWRDLYLSGSTIYLGNAELSSDNGKVSGSFTGSFTGDASSITGVVSSSYALSSSHADRATFAVDTNALYTASITDDTISFLKGGGGTFQLTVDNVASSSFATTASYAENAGVSDWNELTNVPSGIVSSSGQVDHDQTINYSADEHFTQANITTVGTVTSGDVSAILPTGTVSSSTQVDYDSIQNVPSGIVSSSGQVDYAGLSNIPSGIVSSSTQVDYDSIQNVPSGILSASSFTSPSQGTVRATINGVQTDVDTGLQTGDSPQFTNLTLSGDLTVNGTTTYISSSQVDIGDQIITLNANNAAGDGGIYVNDTSTNETGSLLWDVSENYWIGGLLGSESELITLTSLNAKGVVSSSGQVDYTGLSNVPSGIVSSSTQVDYDSIQNVPSGIVSSSGQVDYTGLSNIPSGIVSSSQQINTGSFSGSFSGDGSGLTGVTGVGSGVEIRDDGAIQGTAQILDFVDGIDATFASSTASISLNRTGSFTGSFSGDGSGLTSLTADTATSADTASYLNPLQQLVRITGSVDVAQGNLVLDDNAYFLYGTNTSDTSVSLIGVNGSDIVEIGNQGFNINMVDDVIIDGFVSASGDVTASSFYAGGPTGSFTGEQIILGGPTASVTKQILFYDGDASPGWIGMIDGDGFKIRAEDGQLRFGTGTNNSNQFSWNGTSLYPWNTTKTLGVVNSEWGRLYVIHVSASGDVSASSFIGDGSQVTGVVSSSYALTASYAANGGGGGGVTINNNTDNYLVTATGTADTLDGEQFLTWDGVKLTVSSSDDSQQQLQIYDGTSTGSLHLNNGTFYVQGVSADIRLRRTSGGNSDIVWDGNGFYPAPNGTIRLGNIPNRWENVWTVAVSASGDVSASTFTGDGSNITGVVTSSYSNTASYVETAQTASYFIGDISFPSGLEVTGSLLLDGSMSASGDVTASAFTGNTFAMDSGTSTISGSLVMHATASDGRVLTVISGSNEGYIEIGGGNFWFKSNSLTTRVGILGITNTNIFPDSNSTKDIGTNSLRWRKLYVTDVSASGDVSASTFTGDGSNITGVVSSSHAVTADSASYIDGLISFPNGLDVTGSLLVDGDISASGTITGSAFFGDGSNITGIVTAQTASYIDGFVNFDQGIVVTGSLIASGGLAGIGEPNPSYDLDVNGIVRADAYYWDTAAPQQTPSDSRLKTKVTPLPPQSDRIRDVNLVEFEWSELNDTRPSRQNRTKRQGTKDVGVIAQEIQEIFPELVSEDVDGYLTVSYVGLLIPLIKTVQEQQKQIDELKKLISGEE